MSVDFFFFLVIAWFVQAVEYETKSWLLLSSVFHILDTKEVVRSGI